MPHATTVACLPCKLCQLIWTVMIVFFLGVVLVPLFGLGWKYMHWDEWRREDETLSAHPITSMSFYRITRHDIAVGLVPFIILILLYAIVSMIITGIIGVIVNLVCCCFRRGEVVEEVSTSETQRLNRASSSHHHPSHVHHQRPVVQETRSHQHHHNHVQQQRPVVTAPQAQGTIRGSKRISLFDNMYTNV